MRNLKMFSSFVIVLYAIIACKSSDHLVSEEERKEGWEIVKTDKEEVPTWIIYRLKVEGTNILKYKIVGEIKSSPKVCSNSFKQDIYNLSNGIEKDDDYKYIKYEVVADTNDSLSIYAIHDEPFPLKDTEMNILYTFYSDTSGNAEVRWREAWNEHPVSENKKLNRVESFRGSWQFSSTSSNLYQAVNNVEFDIGGVPLWFAQPMVFKFLKNGLKDMRDISTK
jgi:hypothetical protein